MPCASSASSSGLRASTRNDAPPRLASVIVPLPSLEPDIRGAIAPRIPRLVTAGGAVRLLPEVDEEIWVDRHAPVLDIAVDHQHAAAVLLDVRIELIVPGRE